MKNKSVPEIWDAIKKGEWRKPTSGLAAGYAQANVVILPKKDAFDFLLFCIRNEQSCPIIDVTDPGQTAPPQAGPQADIRYHVPKYRIYRHGELEKEVDSIEDLYTDDMVTFLIGCSFTFEEALMQVGIPVRHIEEDSNVPMYITNIQTNPAGIFSGPMVVSMRPMTEQQAEEAARITTGFRKAHGGPVHIGDPAEIGIKDVQQADFGDAPVIKEGEIPVFWACGVTPQMALKKAKPELVITHSPGHMFITTITEEEIRNQ
ncbi:MAG: putative hydro-lyase [Tindallia sp. MSAO_Bac2]|nr:MAG: putative hydro-lyase [Tindallia sp. MSAO_Bac2]